MAEARDRLTYQRVEQVSRGEGGPHLPCTAGTLSAVVFEDGTVRACEVLEDDLGNLADEAFLDTCHATNLIPVTRDDLAAVYKRAY